MYFHPSFDFFSCFSYFTHSTLLASGRRWWFFFLTFFYIYSCFGVVGISFFSFFNHDTLLAREGVCFIFVTFFFIYSCFGACLDFVFLILYPQHTPRLWEVIYAFHYSLASYTMLPSHIVIITLPFSLLPSQRLFDDLLLVFSYVQYLLGSNTTTSATPSSFTAPPSKL